ncbi:MULTISPECIES: LacI family DNA-binding transcriptional regulator [Saccharopolyspora]|uniref:LacI family DNA-binding transcriptional regulator n=1 Tax=Saccharopolyspora elongata TaxID=2530387 RepID=A0A4R4Z9U8_9PSEU|nr:LacI family DNA-binding transcriptional regulator [Saccharopolyspora elongata]TDD53909.1 LacI family DNA-binding transcriptional regulator [Saccharopolyspora elongata]
MAGLADIAQAAGVSVSTVSRVLNRKAGIKEETRQRVLEVLSQMPHTARGVGALRRTGVVGLLVPELSNPVFPAFAEALESRAALAGYATLLCNTRAAMTEREYVRMLVARGVEGMIFVSPEIANPDNDERKSRNYYEELGAEGVRMVFVNGGAPSLDVPDITVDEHLAGYAAATHLLELGHRRIGFVSGPARALPSRLKRAGWAAALEEAGVEPVAELVANAPFGAEGGAEAMGRLLDGPRPTAVLCSSDVMALGAMREAKRRGLSTPEDLSVVGFDDIPLAAYCQPALTTLAQPIHDMAAAAVDELARQLDPDEPGRGSAGFSRMFRPTLIARESTRRI